MIKVITYGTYDLLHYGHIRLLKRAKALGDYLIVGITSDSYDLSRGKINAQQSLIQRIEAVRETGLADEIIVEEYEGQKIDDIKRYGVDIFTVGSDWKGHFDYLKEYCEVVYLERTEGISSSEIRSERRTLKLGIVGELPFLDKFAQECKYVNGITISGLFSFDNSRLSEELKAISVNSLDELLFETDALYVFSSPQYHYSQIRRALEKKKHVLCESPLTLNTKEWEELKNLAKREKCILMDSQKTAYSTAYYRLLLLAKSGIIGDIVSVDAICTSMTNYQMSKKENFPYIWNSINEWGTTALLPIFQLLGTSYKEKTITTRLKKDNPEFDLFTKISFIFDNAVASLKVGQGVKSEGELIISGTEGYIYVPAPWWKTDYFEVRYENPVNNKRYFYQLDGEGIRYEIVSFVKSIQTGKDLSYIDDDISKGIVQIMSDFRKEKYILI